MYPYITLYAYTCLRFDIEKISAQIISGLSPNRLAFMLPLLGERTIVLDTFMLFVFPLMLALLELLRFMLFVLAFIPLLFVEFVDALLYARRMLLVGDGERTPPLILTLLVGDKRIDGLLTVGTSISERLLRWLSSICLLTSFCQEVSQRCSPSDALRD